MPDGQLTEIPWIHRDHVHRPFDDCMWRRVRAGVDGHGDRERHEAELADALDRLMRRTRNTAGTPPRKKGRRSPVTAPDTAAVLPGLAIGLPEPRRPDDVAGNGAGMPSGAAPGGGQDAAPGSAGPARTSGSGPVPGREWGDSLDALAHTDPGGENADENEEGDAAGGEDCGDVSPDAPRAGFGLYDAQAEAESW